MLEWAVCKVSDPWDISGNTPLFFHKKLHYAGGRVDLLVYCMQKNRLCIIVSKQKTINQSTFAGLTYQTNCVLISITKPKHQNCTLLEDISPSQTWTNLFYFFRMESILESQVNEAVNET